MYKDSWSFARSWIFINATHFDLIHVELSSVSFSFIWNKICRCKYLSHSIQILFIRWLHSQHKHLWSLFLTEIAKNNERRGMNSNRVLATLGYLSHEEDRILYTNCSTGLSGMIITSLISLNREGTGVNRTIFCPAETCWSLSIKMNNGSHAKY